MRRLLVIALLLCSGAISAQTDERQVRTLQLGEAEEPAIESEARRDGTSHPDENLALARKLVDLGPDGDSAAEPDAGCIPEPATMRRDIADAYRARPAEFHGISPRSAYWPDVERAWHDYYVERCAAQNAESPAAIMARSYAANLSIDELREVAAFQESRAGRAFIAASARAQQELQHALADRAEADPDAAINTFRQAMLGLKAKYQRAPK